MDLYDVMRTTPAVREFTDDPLPDDVCREIIETYRTALDQVDIICLQDYGKGTLPPAMCKEMIRLAGGRTRVPQIFINGRHIGGSDELQVLETAGRLDELLASAP